MGHRKNTWYEHLYNMDYLLEQLYKMKEKTENLHHLNENFLKWNVACRHVANTEMQQNKHKLHYPYELITTTGMYLQLTLLHAVWAGKSHAKSCKCKYFDV